MATSAKSQIYLSPADVCRRYGDTISVKTLGNWRVRGGGPPFAKVSGNVLYPLAGLQEWERKRTRGISKFAGDGK